MTAIDSTKPTIDTMDESVSVSMARSRSDKHVASRPLRDRALEIARYEDGLSDALQRDDRQMLPAAGMLDAQLDHRTRPSANERVRLRTRRAARPSLSRLESWPPASRESAELDLVRRTSAESRAQRRELRATRECRPHVVLEHERDVRQTLGK